MEDRSICKLERTSILHSSMEHLSRATGKEPMDTAAESRELDQRLARIEQMLQTLIEQRTVKEWYTTAEVAALLGKAEFTVREWCRLGRVNARKKKCGRGVAGEWVVSHEELTRVRNEGLLPDPNAYRHVK